MRKPDRPAPLRDAAVWSGRSGRRVDRRGRGGRLDAARRGVGRRRAMRRWRDGRRRRHHRVRQDGRDARGGNGRLRAAAPGAGARCRVVGGSGLGGRCAVRGPHLRRRRRVRVMVVVRERHDVGVGRSGRYRGDGMAVPVPVVVRLTVCGRGRCAVLSRGRVVRSTDVMADGTSRCAVVPRSSVRLAREHRRQGARRRQPDGGQCGGGTAEQRLRPHAVKSNRRRRPAHGAARPDQTTTSGHPRHGSCSTRMGIPYADRSGSGRSTAVGDPMQSTPPRQSSTIRSA